MAIKLTVSQSAPVSLSYVEAAIKPEVTGHVTPTYEEQTVYPAAGTTFGRVEVAAIPDPTDIKEISSNGDHDVRRYGVARVDVQPTLQSKTATPTEQAQTILPDTGYDGLESVNIARIPTEYIIPTGTKNISQNGTESVREYDSVNVSVVPTLQDKTIVPTKQTQTVNADSGYDGLGTVQVDPIPSEYIVPQGKVTINQNGTVNVSQYAEAEVDIQQPDGVLLYDLNQNGNPTKAIIKGITTVGYRFGDRGGDRNSNGGRVFRDVTDLTIYDATSLNKYLFNYWMNLSIITFYTTAIDLGWHSLENLPLLTTVVIHGDVSVNSPFSQIANFKNFIVDGQVLSWGNLCNGEAVAVELYDFSKCVSVFTLSSVSYLPHAEGCVIRVPQSLLAEWQAATNWNALTGVVWEGV